MSIRRPSYVGPGVDGGHGLTRSNGDKRSIKTQRSPRGRDRWGAAGGADLRSALARSASHQPQPLRSSAPRRSLRLKRRGCLRHALATVEDANRAESFVATALQIGELAFVACGVAGFGGVGSWTALHPGNRFAAKRDRQVVTLSRLLKRGERLDRLALIIADDA